jgi:hypothetical protein
VNRHQEPVPENAAAQYAVASALADRASDTNLDRICAYLERMPKQGLLYRILGFNSASIDAIELPFEVSAQLTTSLSNSVL